MLPVKQIVRKGGKLFIKHLPMILSVVASAGVIGVAVTTAKQTPKANELLTAAKEEKGDELTVVEKVVTVAKPYAIPAGIATLTIASIIGSNYMAKKQIAGLSAAYLMLGKKFDAYRNQVANDFGADIEKQITESIKEPEQDDSFGQVEKYWVYEPLTDQYFISDDDSLTKMFYHMNHDLITYDGWHSAGIITVNDYIRRLNTIGANLKTRPDGDLYFWEDCALMENYGYVWLHISLMPFEPPKGHAHETCYKLECAESLFTLDPNENPVGVALY